MKLNEVSVRYIKGIGPKKLKEFQKHGINTVEDLLYYFPHRYEDRRNFLSISQLKEGQSYTVKAKVIARGERRSFRKKGFRILEVVVSDGTQKLFCVWFNQPYLKEYFKAQTELILYGKVEIYAGRLQMNSPEFEIVEKDSSISLHIGRITPIYTLPKTISQRRFRQLIRFTLDKYITKINDFLPYDIRSRHNLLNIAKALINIHFPEEINLQKEAHRRLSFEEFFIFQIPLALRKLKNKLKPGIIHKTEGGFLEEFILTLPFRLTSAQQRVITEIKEDMAKAQPMHRLLQGDVGSGKTIVAIIASVIAIQGNYQVAFMVPTEILAKQHFLVIKERFSKLNRAINSALLISSLQKKEKERVYRQIKEGKIDIVVGTHALLEEEVQFRNLGLVIIDEQHKFGVGQRALLPKKGINPDVLIMTATPIPRSLAITIYGDMDFSVLDELPYGPRSVKTLLFSIEEANKAYVLAKEEIRKGRQVFIVYPVIEGSSRCDILGAQIMYEEFRKNEFKEFRIGLIHGRLRQAEQEKIIKKFQKHQLDILVTTTVLEVGIDLPNASCMIIQYAERFGLAQLHQLRGRVGRGSNTESLCILIADIQNEESHRRLEAMMKYNDGFRIAEEDLKIRGPGEFFGKRQHGLTELKIANPLIQLELLKLAKQEAFRLIHQDPQLVMPQHKLLKEKLIQRFPDYERLMVVG
ncbi:MAG: ATP-dependent DNA helicase RecG [Candidatus Omnitrophica bacterium]|nr:ATP-dependent DNA helicase RecG [Candidatus Omnitrophota bacterium]